MINLENTYWDRIRGYITEFRVDSRWVLRDGKTKKPYGSLRIVSHPDLPPGHLRSIFIYVTSKKPKSKKEIIKTIHDYHIDVNELEVYSIDEDVSTEKNIYEAPMRELEELFSVKVLEKEKE